jgi:hypothetical protein
MRRLGRAARAVHIAAAPLALSFRGSRGDLGVMARSARSGRVASRRPGRRGGAARAAALLLHGPGRLAPDRHPQFRPLSLERCPFARDAVALYVAPRGRDALPLRHSGRADATGHHSRDTDAPQGAPLGEVGPKRTADRRWTRRRQAYRRRRVRTRRDPARWARLRRRGLAAAVQANAAVAWTGRVQRTAAGTPHDGFWCVHGPTVPGRRNRSLCGSVRRRRTAAYRCPAAGPELLHVAQSRGMKAPR